MQWYWKICKWFKKKIGNNISVELENELDVLEQFAGMMKITSINVELKQLENYKNDWTKITSNDLKYYAKLS